MAEVFQIVVGRLRMLRPKEVVGRKKQVGFGGCCYGSGLVCGIEFGMGWQLRKVTR